MKVGDQVIRTGNDFGGVKKGCIYIVTDLGTNRNQRYIKVEGSLGKYLSTKFKKFQVNNIDDAIDQIVRTVKGDDQ